MRGDSTGSAPAAGTPMPKIARRGGVARRVRPAGAAPFPPGRSMLHGKKIIVVMPAYHAEEDARRLLRRDPARHRRRRAQRRRRERRCDRCRRRNARHPRRARHPSNRSWRQPEDLLQRSRSSAAPTSSSCSIPTISTSRSLITAMAAMVAEIGRLRCRDRVAHPRQQHRARRRHAAATSTSRTGCWRSCRMSSSARSSRSSTPATARSRGPCSKQLPACAELRRFRVRQRDARAGARVRHARGRDLVPDALFSRSEPDQLPPLGGLRLRRALNGSSSIACGSGSSRARCFSRRTCFCVSRPARIR